MAIWTPCEGSTPTFGAEGGEVWARGSGSNTLQAAPRSANAQEREQFSQWPSGSDWHAVWEDLDSETKAAWAAYAAGRPLEGFFGRPRVRTAKDAFALYQRTQTTVTGAAPSPPYTVPGEPTYAGERQPFEEWLDPAEDFAIVTRVASAEDRDYFFVSARPVQGRAALNRARTRPVGTFTLPAGDAGRRWTAPTSAARTLDGAEAWTESNELWLMAWEVSAGWPRAVLDPCHTPPPNTWKTSYTVRAKTSRGPWVYRVVTWNETAQQWANEDGTAQIEVLNIGTPSQSFHARCRVDQWPVVTVEGDKVNAEEPSGGYVCEGEWDPELSVS